MGLLKFEQKKRWPKPPGESYFKDLPYFRFDVNIVNIYDISKYLPLRNDSKKQTSIQQGLK